MRGIIVAIDGFSSAGKSSFAKLLAARLGYIFIDTGAMYRAITLYAINNNLNTDAEVIAALPKIDIAFNFNLHQKCSDIYLNGKNVADSIRELAVSKRVSEISSISGVREKLVALQQAMGKNKGIVMDGRDIGTVVFPNAELKIFVTADPSVRAQRRYDEMIALRHNVSFEDIKNNIIARDEADQNRSVSPLRKAEDAIVLDNSTMTIDDQMKWVEPLLQERGVEI